MADDSNETTGAAPAPKGADGAQAKSHANGALPKIESPPLSPAGEITDADAAPEPALDPTDLMVIGSAPTSPRPRLRFRARHKRQALLAASVAMAAAFGVVAGLAAGGGFATPKHEVASLSENHATQRSIGKLGKEIAALKVSIAAAAKSARSDIAKTAERVPETTGSIPVPPRAVPTPTPRPIATAMRAPLLRDWAIRFVRDGYVYVGQGHGDTYQVQLGAPLPGLGPVQAVKHKNGRWLVVTPKGLIVAERDRRYFAPF